MKFPMELHNDDYYNEYDQNELSTITTWTRLHGLYFKLKA